EESYKHEGTKDTKRKGRVRADSIRGTGGSPVFLRLKTRASRPCHEFQFSPFVSFVPSCLITLEETPPMIDSPHLVKPAKKFNLKDCPTDDTGDFKDKDDAKKPTKENVEKLDSLQE